MRRSSMFIIVLGALVSLLVFVPIEVSAQGQEVKFRGIVNSDEEFGGLVCYGSYYCSISVTQILHDPNNTLSPGDVVTICYNKSLSLKTGDPVECYGRYYKIGVCPFQYCGKIVCMKDGYYVIPELPSFLILPLFMIATLLAAMIYRRKRFVE